MWALLSGSVARWVLGAGIAAVIAGGGWLALRTHYYNVGWKAALAAVAAKDAKAVKAAKEIQDEVDKCFEEGGVWNVEPDWKGEAKGCEKQSQ